MEAAAAGWQRLRTYDRGWLRADVLGGLTVGAMLVPQGMAYAELAGMAPITGCYAALLPLLTYPFLGSSRHLGVGPEPGTAILAATGVGALAAGDPVKYAALMGGLAGLVGVLCVVAWVLRLGVLAELLSKPVLVGYISGVGLTLIASQLGKATGVPIAADGPVERVVELLGSLSTIHPLTLVVFVATLATQLAFRRWRPTWPGALIGVVGATALSVVIGGPTHGLAVVGDLPAGLPAFSVPSIGFADVQSLVPIALGVALVGYTDNVLTGRAIGAREGYAVDANQELLALGVANLGAGVSQGFPVSSSASRTAVPASLGTHSQLSSLVALGFLVAALVFLQPLLSAMPVAALAAVIVAAGLAVVDVEGFVRLWTVNRSEVVLAVFGMVAVMALDVLQGVLLALVASVVLMLSRIARPHDAVLTNSEDLDGWVDADQYGLAPSPEGLLVYRFDAPLFFVNATRFRQRLLEMLHDKPGVERAVVLDFEGVGNIDATAIDMLEALLAELSEEGKRLSVARANPAVSERLSRAGLLEPDGPLTPHATIRGAVRETVRPPDGTTDSRDR